jgi:serine/threonine protein kinase
LRNALEDRTDPANRLTFNRNQRGRIFFDVISGMAQLHDRGYIHRDFKPDNIFIDDDDQVFIGDLGSCVKGAVESDSNEGLTPSYYNQNDLDQNLYDNKSEVYALGITFIELITGRRIVNYLTGVNYVKGAPEHQIIRNVLDDEVRKGSVSRKAADCLLTMVHPDRSQRPDIVRVAREFAAESIQSDDVMLFIGNLKAVGKSNNEIRSSIEHLKSIGVPIVDSDIANLAEIDDKFDAEKDRVNKAVRANPDIKEFNNPKRYSGIGVCAVPSFNEAQNKWEFKVTNILKPGSAEKCGCKIGDVITVAGYDKTQLKEAATLVRETGIGQNNAVISTNASLTEPLVKPAIFVFENNTKKYKLDKFGVDKAIDPSSIFRPTSSAHFLSSAGRTI